MKILRENALVIEDETMIKNLIQKVLVNNDFKNVFVAESGEEALEILNNEDIKFITCDITLPDIFGVDLIKKIREINKHAEIIVLSAISDEILSKPLKQYDIHSFILKGHLVKALNAILENDVLVG